MPSSGSNVRLLLMERSDNGSSVPLFLLFRSIGEVALDGGPLLSRARLFPLSTGCREVLFSLSDDIEVGGEGDKPSGTLLRRLVDGGGEAS